MIKFLFSFILIFCLSINFQGSFADCGDESPNTMDKECASTCTGTDDDPKGCYLLKDDGKANTNDDCKKASTDKYPKARATVCCCKD